MWIKFLLARYKGQGITSWHSFWPLLIMTRWLMWKNMHLAISCSLIFWVPLWSTGVRKWASLSIHLLWLCQSIASSEIWRPVLQEVRCLDFLYCMFHEVQIYILFKCMYSHTWQAREKRHKSKHVARVEIKLSLQDLSFSQLCWWRFKSSSVWCCVDWLVIIIMEESATSIFGVQKE